MLVTNNAEGGSNGAVPTASDTGSGTSWTSVSVDTNRITYSNEQIIRGNLAYRFDQGSSGITLTWNSSVLGTLTEHYGRFYAYTTGAPSVSNRFVRGTSGSQSFAINLGSTSKIFIKNTADTTIWQSSTVISHNNWFRIEWHLTHAGASGSLEVRIYTDPNSNTYTETSGSIVDDYLNNFNHITFGPVNTAGTMPLYYIDDMAVGDSTEGWLGSTQAPTRLAWLSA